MKKFQALMKSRFENAKKDNKGFSLVELIIAVVILGIIAVVAIGGLYGNVTKSRKNTDVSNARDIQSALSTLSADKDVYTWASNSSATEITISWSTAQPTITNPTTPPLDISSKISAILTDGFPTAKAGGSFELKITPDSTHNGNVTITCKAYKGADASSGLLEAED